MTCAKLKKIYLKGIVIVDLRSKKDYLKSHIPASINIPHTEFIIDHKKYVNPKVEYYLICDEGTVSNNVVKLLAKYKYKLINIVDGFDAWDGPKESSKQ